MRIQIVSVAGVTFALGVYFGFRDNGELAGLMLSLTAVAGGAYIMNEYHTNRLEYLERKHKFSEKMKSKYF